MDLIAHFVFGIWLAKKFQNFWAIFLSCIIDIDHFFGYIYDKRKKQRIEIPSILHLAYRPRSWLHSFTGVLILSIPFLLFLPSDLVFISLLSHLFFDLLDKNGIFLFPPLLNKKIRGRLPVGYLPEDSRYLKAHKRSHLPSILLIIFTGILLFYGI